jgi:hypothetical protein
MHGILRNGSSWPPVVSNQQHSNIEMLHDHVLHGRATCLPTACAVLEVLDRMRQCFWGTITVVDIITPVNLVANTKFVTGVCTSMSAHRSQLSVYTASIFGGSGLRTISNEPFNAQDPVTVHVLSLMSMVTRDIISKLPALVQVTPGSTHMQSHVPL